MSQTNSSLAASHQQLLSCLLAPVAADGTSIASVANRILSSSDESNFDEFTPALIQACASLFEVGKSHQGIDLGKELAAVAKRLDRQSVERRVFNILGAQYCDIADFASSMKYLEAAIVLARKLRDPIAEMACLANVVATLQEMGHYRQAIEMATRALALEHQSSSIATVKLQCASNGLFAAHRTGNSAAAAVFLAAGEAYLKDNVDLLRRVFFERSRVLYLIDLGDVAGALKHVEATKALVGSSSNNRITSLMTVSQAVCAWGLGNKHESRLALRKLYRESRISRLYHAFVLQALIKVYGDSETQAEAEAGLSYARELVEFTTSVKKAKFYRQLQSKKADSQAISIRPSRSSSLLATDLDPFGFSKDWLTSTSVGIVGDDAESPVRRELAKHEELTVIHEDMARLRVASLRREIRTDAVDTAENWAIAAEFFDDETGRHCYRVGHLASMLARQIGMDDTFCIQIEHAARLHDIGKIAVNEVILLKPGPLDAAEMAAMRLHTEVGAQILAGSEDPTLKMAVEVARHHHEWWNGNGYPRRLSGRDIPLAARVSAFADVYDALTHARAYKSAWTHERALDEIVRLAGTQFDPNLIEPFVIVLKRYLSDLDAEAIPGFADMDSNSLIASRRKLMETITAS